MCPFLQPGGVHALKQDGLSDAKVVFDAGPSEQVYGNSENLAAAKGAYFPGTTYSTRRARPCLRA